MTLGLEQAGAEAGRVAEVGEPPAPHAHLGVKSAAAFCAAMLPADQEWQHGAKLLPRDL